MSDTAAPTAGEALIAARNQFHNYAEHHRGKLFAGPDERASNEAKATRNDELGDMCQLGIENLAREIDVKDAAATAARRQRDLFAEHLTDRITRFYALQVALGQMKIDHATGAIRSELAALEQAGAAIAKEHGIDV